MLSYPLTNCEIQKYYQNESKVNGVYSRNNLSQMDKMYIINLDRYESIGIHWIALHLNAENVTCLNSFRVKHIAKEIRHFTGKKNITINIYKIHAYDSVMFFRVYKFIFF